MWLSFEGTMNSINGGISLLSECRLLLMRGCERLCQYTAVKWSPLHSLVPSLPLNGFTLLRSVFRLLHLSPAIPLVLLSAHKTVPPPFALHSLSLAREICLTMGGSAQGQIRSHSPRSHSHCFFHPSFPLSLSPHSFQIISAAHNNNYWGRRRGDKGEAADGREEGRASTERRSVKKYGCQRKREVEELLLLDGIGWVGAHRENNTANVPVMSKSLFFFIWKSVIFFFYVSMPVPRKSIITSV